jgi:hypothetical protein
MVKTKTESKDLNKGEDFLRLGKHYYQYAANMEDGYDIEERDITQERIDSSWQLAASDFWQAFVLGNTQAPLWLFKCFGQGVGVKPNDYITALMFGVALKLNDSECNQIPIEKRPKIPESMKHEIEKLAKFILETNETVPSQGVSMEVVSQQMTIFDQEIKLPGEQSMLQCFIQNNPINTEEINLAGEGVSSQNSVSGCCCVII